jgi:hypothetical protein
MSTATWLDPVVTKSDVFRSLQFMRGDDTDDTAGFQAMLAAVRANGGGHIVMQKPRARYRFVATGQGYPGQDFPSNTEIYGEGGTVIYWAGAPKIADFGSRLGSGKYGWIEIPPHSANILVRDLVIESDNTPFVSYFNNQSSGILIIPSGGPPTRDVVIRDCEFLNHVGFPVHAPGGGLRIHVLRNRYTNCANGENVNADYSVHYQNRFVNTESMEAGGAFNVFALNDFSMCVTNGALLSLGGSTSPGARAPGSLVMGNSIRNAAGLGIIVAEAFVSGWLQGNVIDGAGNSAIQIGGNNKAYCDHNAVVGNLCTGARYGINVFSAFATDTLVAGNTCTEDFYAFLCSSTRATVIWNRFSGSSKDVAFNVADGTLFTSNIYDDSHYYVLGSAAFIPPVLPTGRETAILGALDQGFALIQIRNWSRASAVALDFTGILRTGEAFAIYNPCDLLGTPVVRRAYSGAPISIPMGTYGPPDDWSVSTRQPLPRPGLNFGAFVLARAD